MIHLAGLISGKDIEIKTIGLRLGEKLHEELLKDTSTKLSTCHVKIMIVKERDDDYSDIKNKIGEINKYC